MTPTSFRQKERWPMGCQEGRGAFCEANADGGTLYVWARREQGRSIDSLSPLEGARMADERREIEHEDVRQQR